MISMTWEAKKSQATPTFDHFLAPPQKKILSHAHKKFTKNSSQHAD
jgi:hypothetical protein